MRNNIIILLFYEWLTKFDHTYNMSQHISKYYEAIGPEHYVCSTYVCRISPINVKLASAMQESQSHGTSLYDRFDKLRVSH